MNIDKSLLSGKELVDAAVERALEKKAEDIVLFNPGNQSGVAEWFLICHGNNVVQNKAIAEAIIVGLKEENTAPWYKEGLDGGRWVLLDYSDVVVNVLLPELREFYALEKLWEGYSRIDIPNES